MLQNSVKQGLFGFLPMTGTKPRCTCERGGEHHFTFTNYEIRASPSQGKTNANRQILPAATSFPWPNWNYLHIYLFPINVQLSACVQLEMGGQVCLLLRRPFHTGTPRHQPYPDAVLFIYFSILTCWLSSQCHERQADVLQLLSCNCPKLTSLAPDLASSWSHPATNSPLCLPSANLKAAPCI